MKARRALAWIVAGMMLLMSVALSPSLGIAEEAPALEGRALEEPTDSVEPKALLGEAPEPAAPVDDMPLVPAAAADGEAPAPKDVFSDSSTELYIPAYAAYDGVAFRCLSLTADRTYDGYHFRCKVSNISGSVYSDSAVLKVNQAPHD